MQESVERIKIGLHEGVVHLEERKVGGSVEEISKADEGVRGFHVQEEHSSQEGHALDVADVWSVAGVGSKHVV